MQSYSSTTTPSASKSPEQSPNKRIYLAGKIGKNDWRHTIVDGLREAVSGSCPEPNDMNWPILSRAIFNRFDYVGPFFISCDHGCFHVPHGHGLGDPSRTFGKHSGDEPWARSLIARNCLARLSQADLVFVFLDSTSAYGSLIELGFAVDLAYRRQATANPLHIAIAHNLKPGQARELWFAFHLPKTEVSFVSRPLCPDGDPDWVNLKGHLLAVTRDLGWFCDSPLEEMFWRAWVPFNGRFPLIPQFEVLGGRYRLDFAHLQTKTAIEVDGFAYHSDRPAFERDRKRDRDLTEAGWKVIRFASQELMDHPDKCTEQAARMIQQAEGV